jgi:hypothetical protein
VLDVCYFNSFECVVFRSKLEKYCLYKYFRGHLTMAVFVFRCILVLWNIKFFGSGHKYRVRGREFGGWKLRNSNEDKMYIFAHCFVM